MNREEQSLSEEQLDFLNEMMNIGAGHAVTALSQLLQCPVDLKRPQVYSPPLSQAASMLGDISSPAACVKMGMVGDVSGELFFIVPSPQKADLIYLAKRAALGPGQMRAKARDHEELDLSVLMEIGNIIAGVYLRAIYDFCKLNIYHTVPTLVVDMIQPLLDKSLTAMRHKAQMVILVENQFTVCENSIRTFFLLISLAESIETLVASIEQARISCGL